MRPGNASVITNINGYEWGDDKWKKNKPKDTDKLVDEPISI